MSELLQALTLAVCLCAWWVVRATGIGWAGRPLAGTHFREHGRRLLVRSDALSHARVAILSEGWPIEERRAETLKALTELRDEASAELGRFREEVGIPGF